MMTEIKNILNEGGANMGTDNNTPVVEEPVLETPVVEEPVIETPVVEEPAAADPEPIVEEPVVTEEPANEPADPEPVPAAEFVKEDEEVCPECGKPLDECECDKKNEYVLEEIPEYVELQTKYAELETKMNELANAHDALKIEHEALVAFKANVDRKEKEALINSFYMLSDELKQEVVDKIDEYSLDEIEAKLSILCVRNKVSFDLEDKTVVEPISYSLKETGFSNEVVPEWVKAIQDRIAEK